MPSKVLDAWVRRIAEHSLLAVDPRAWMDETTRNADFLAQFGDRLPEAIRSEHHALRDRLARDLEP